MKSHAANAFPNDSAESRAKKKLRALWQRGDLFHVTSRYPRKRNVPKVDRLAAILRNGLLAPAQSQDGLVSSDHNIVVSGYDIAYDSLVFLHRFGELSPIYTICEPGRFAVFVDPAIPVLTPESLAPNWILLCQDEVYVRDCVALEKLVGVAVHPSDTASVMSEFLEEFQRLELPLYDYDGKVLWPA
jgi:hypothetical protein